MNTEYPAGYNFTPQDIANILGRITLQQEQARIQQEQERIEREKERKENDKRFKKMEAFFNSQWGKLMESLVEGDLVPMLQERGIMINDTSTRRKGTFEGKQYEFDIIAKNGEKMVVVEVKTTLRSEDVDWFCEQLADFKRIFPEYKNNTIYGAVAYLKEDSKSVLRAQRKGLLVIRATGNSARIINEDTFEPTPF